MNPIFHLYNVQMRRWPGCSESFTIRPISLTILASFARAMPVQCESDWRDHIVKLIKSVRVSSSHLAWYRHVLMLQSGGYLHPRHRSGGGGGRAVWHNHKQSILTNAQKALKLKVHTRAGLTHVRTLFATNVVALALHLVSISSCSIATPFYGCPCKMGLREFQCNLLHFGQYLWLDL